MGHLLPPWERDHIRLFGDKSPDSTPGDKIISACLGTRASPGSLGTGALAKPLMWHPAGSVSPSPGTTVPSWISHCPQVPMAGDNTEVTPRTAPPAWLNLIIPNLRRGWH